MQPSRMSVLLMERRQESRVIVNWPGKLLFAGAEVPCLVNDVSEGGAGMTLLETEPVNLPRQLDLVWEGADPKPCEIVWSKGSRVGLKFL